MAGKSAQEIACFLFQKHYKNLSSGLQAHLPMVVAHLYSENLVSADNRDKTLDNTTSQLEKCMCLLKDVEDRIRRDYSVFEKFCAVLCSQEVSLSHLGDPMLHDFQQLCPKPTIHGSYNIINESSSKFTKPAPESQIDATDEGTSNVQPSRSDKYSASDDSGGKIASYVMSFGTPQQVLDTDNDSYMYSGHEQVVPEKESGRPKRANTVAPYVGPFDIDHFSVKHSAQDQDSEEKMLVSDLVLSWDRVKLKCANCASIQAEYEKKLQDIMKFYDKRLKSSVTKSASFRHVKRLEEEKQRLEDDKQHLVKAMQIQSVQSEKDHRQLEEQLEENEKEIEQLQLQVEKQMSELMGMQRLLEEKRKEQKELKSTLSSKERELHEIAQSARHCPVYSTKKRREHFERKKELCEEIQSLVVKFFATSNVDGKSKLHNEIQAKFSHFTSLKRRRSFSL